MTDTREQHDLATKNVSRPLWVAELKVLKVLLRHPYLDPSWIGEYLGATVRVNKALSLLRARGYAERWTFTREHTALRSVWAITPEGVSALGQHLGVRPSELARAYAYRRGRMTWLVLNLERVTMIRRFVKILEGYNPSDTGPRKSVALATINAPVSPVWRWQVMAWQEEIQVEGKQGNATRLVEFHGEVTLKHCDAERYLRVLVEYDNPNVPVQAQRARFVRWLKAENARRVFDTDGNLLMPSLVVIAHNAYRRSDYIGLFRGIATGNRLALPGIYIALEADVDAVGGNPAQRIWHQVETGEGRMLLADERGWTKGLAHSSSRATVIRVQSQVPVLVVPPTDGRTVGIAADDLAALNLSIRSTDHRLIRLIAAHPLLSEQEMAILMRCDRAQISAGLKKLVAMNLIESLTAPLSDAIMQVAEIAMDARKFKRKMETRYYATTERGERYLAAIDGFGEALERYRQAKLWSPEQTQRLVRQWSHTRLGNILFAKLAQAMNARDLELEWFSETESRLYFSISGKQYAFLPDGRGMLKGKGRVVPFVVEIDTTRSNEDKIRVKIARYYAGVIEHILPENPNETLRILMVTHSPDRMRHLIKIANEVTTEMDSGNPPLRQIAPVLFAQQQTILLAKLVVDQPVWIDLNGQRTYCFEEFRPLPPKPDEMRTGRVIYKS
ncbi:MAG TPA: MarR family winged helix-turn-helix transcriptional regulator [Anaerolineae bacterium]|nr:MarR family winged helix-turn-helix transcriptional regulator [Anaerolineae bacterium]